MELPWAIRRRGDMISCRRIEICQLGKWRCCWSRKDISGPRLFERTVSLTRRYRELLDEGVESRPKEPTSRKANQDTRGDRNRDVSSRIQQTVERDANNLKPDTPEGHAASKSQAII